MAALALLGCALAVIVVDRACAPATSAEPAAQAGRPAAGAAIPAALSAGACQVLAPSGRNRERTVFIDPGHGGPDPGVLGTTRAGARVTESASALAVATLLARQLRADGYRVALSRSADSSVVRFPAGDLQDGTMTADQVRQDLQARVRCANQARAAALVSIHFNGYPDTSVGGTQTVYDAARPFAGENERLARSLQSALVSRLRLPDRGVTTDDELTAPTLSDGAGSYGHLILLGPARAGWVDQGTAMPGAVVEPLFLTSPDEASLAASATGQKRIAQALAAGLEDFLPPRGGGGP